MTMTTLPSTAAHAPTRAVRVDACVFPMPTEREDLRRFMREPWRRMPFSSPEDSDYVSPLSPYSAAATGNALPGSDPQQVIDVLGRDRGVDVIVLLPRTRGLLPDIDLSAEICSATNRWLAEDWLGADSRGVFRGSIRVDPRELGHARKEIERYAGDSRFVQIAVTTQTQAPLGHRAYEPLWSMATDAGLPVVVCADAANNGVQFPATLAGTPRYHIEKVVLAPVNYAFHLASLLAEGVFERHPDLRVVFADGGHDLLPPLMWRLDKDWRPQRAEVPWVKRSPLEYVRTHVRFVTDSLAGGDDPDVWGYWQGLAWADEIVMFGSRYPTWGALGPDSAARGLDEAARERVLGGNARDLYDR
jgi:predicted TIM-barrel fold metal-dependent hydrolase